MAFGAPVLVDENSIVIAGHGRLAAIKQLGKVDIPAIVLRDLTSTQKRSLALADNRIALDAGWDRAILAIELPELAAILLEKEDDITLTAFGHAEIDELHVDFAEHADDVDTIDQKLLSPVNVSRPGDLWLLGHHKLLQGDARSAANQAHLMDGRKAAMACYDVPHNVKIANVVGRGSTKHSEFAMASGEMTRVEFGGFLIQTLTNSRDALKNGALLALSWCNAVPGRSRGLRHHPTPKPVGLLADAMKDCTGRNEIVLDCFVGSGSTILAAERVGRRAYRMEIESRYMISPSVAGRL